MKESFSLNCSQTQPTYRILGYLGSVNRIFLGLYCQFPDCNTYNVGYVFDDEYIFFFQQPGRVQQHQQRQQPLHEPAGAGHGQHEGRAGRQPRGPAGEPARAEGEQLQSPAEGRLRQRGRGRWAGEERHVEGDRGTGRQFNSPVISIWISVLQFAATVEHS